MKHAGPDADDPGVEPALAPVQERALEWVVHMHSGTATAADRSAYLAWREANPAQRAAASEAERLWGALDPALRTPSRRVAMSVALGLVAIGSAFGIAAYRSSFGDQFSHLSTGTGERRAVILADGTRLDLDSATRLDFDLAPDERRLTLKAGRVFVEVGADKARPFLVFAAGGTVRALGTAFVAERAGDAVAVAVTEHEVEVAYPKGGSPTVRIGAGQSVTYDPLHGLERVTAQDPLVATAWRRGRLVFDGKPLGEVVAEIARYRRGWVVFADATLRQRLVTGAFPVDDTDALLRALPKMMPVRIVQYPMLTVIEAAPAR